VELHWNCTFFALGRRAGVKPMAARRGQLRNYFGNPQSGSPALQQRHLNIVFCATCNRKLKTWLTKYIVCI